MEYSESFRVGIRSIMAHKMRSLLTTLGVIFGVAAVIAMLSIGEGAKRDALEQIRLLGTNNIRINAVKLTGDKAREAESKYSDGLSYKDGLLIRSNVPSVRAVTPIRFVDAPVMKGNKESAARVIGTDHLYTEVTNFSVDDGRFITPLDISEAKRVCVIGSKVKRELFGFRSPIGHRIRIGEEWFRWSA
ncbi:MAG: ABC transporter permease [candidate division KSB1 bacterium]|nr:ABC transporter permease [candidate division KSB1 bacterium]